MDSKAILLAMLTAWLLAGLVLLTFFLLNLDLPNTPQILILFGLWVVPGYVAANCAGNAGTLHGLLSGVLGMLVIVLGVKLAIYQQLLAPHDFFEKSSVLVVVLAGFWAAVGGMVADSVRLIKAKRAMKRSQKND